MATKPVSSRLERRPCACIQLHALGKYDSPTPLFQRGMKSTSVKSTELRKDVIGFISMGTLVMNGPTRIDKVNYVSKYNRRSDDGCAHVQVSQVLLTS